ncbi:hypothetical protein EXIGLDRAFT_763576 [Exidia glandulosa HHB12029]|uniref:Uncharacterized protein n=1 Tax=Exidia glandulosa HHB12029 TaxID=1314781 RepID=A0A165LWM6_EXIGL|nr:hypothetical protein EXIGLDRAFT_763576 [Exidia glandulosa HHB12029]
MAGRKRKYTDNQERKRAYYERHAERHREKARDRWHARQAKQKVAEEEQEIEDEEDALFAMLGVFWTVESTTKFETLLYCLTGDLRKWRSSDTDVQEYTALTEAGISMKASNLPLKTFVERTAKGRRIAQAVAEIAAQAETLVDPTLVVEETAVWAVYGYDLQGPILSGLSAVRKRALRIVSNLDEVCLMYGVEDALRTKFEARHLLWQVYSD